MQRLQRLVRQPHQRIEIGARLLVGVVHRERARQPSRRAPFDEARLAALHRVVRRAQLRLRDQRDVHKPLRASFRTLDLHKPAKVLGVGHLAGVDHALLGRRVRTS